MRNLIRRVGFVLCAVWLGGPVAAHAQQRDGFWLGLGAGYGSARVDCDTCGDQERETSAAGYVKLGGTLSPRALLGGEINLWSREEAGLQIDLYSATATLTFYPNASSGFFVKGGAGASFVGAEFRTGGNAISADLGSGLGLIAGAGYDIRIGDNVSITPAVNYWYGTPGDLKLGGTVVERDWSQSVLDLTVGITFH